MATTHSPHFVQHVPLHDLRLVALQSGRTTVASIAPAVVSTLPWNPRVETLRAGKGSGIFTKSASGCVATIASFSKDVGDALAHCYRIDPDPGARATEVAALRRASRILISEAEERDLSFSGRRIRGEIFFARRWILVEGVCEYLMLHALGDAFGWSLDAHGVAVVDFQNGGNPGIYVALAEALRIPWNMITDGDPAGDGFREQILSRGFFDADLADRLTTLAPPNDLEDQLLADGHEALLRELLAESLGPSVWSLKPGELRARLKKRKTDYMSRLAMRVSKDPALAVRMPEPFVALASALRDSTA